MSHNFSWGVVEIPFLSIWSQFAFFELKLDLASVPLKATNSAKDVRSPDIKLKFKERKLGPNGEKRNFYNPPGKVMRHLQQASYYDNFYGTQG
jgi:hypothetical protein